MTCENPSDTMGTRTPKREGRIDGWREVIEEGKDDLIIEEGSAGEGQTRRPRVKGYSDDRRWLAADDLIEPR